MMHGQQNVKQYLVTTDLIVYYLFHSFNLLYSYLAVFSETYFLIMLSDWSLRVMEK